MQIREFYRGKNVFITGGTGFLGKVLIEKLLRSCPDIGNIYMLIREKKGKSIEQRLTNIKSLALFDLLRNEYPGNLDKIIPVRGDVREINLGLNEADRQTIIDNVNIIYHTAASVRFDDFLKDAIFINVRATREVAKLALELKHISLFIHVSTTYCNADKSKIEEKCYPAHADWQDAIEIAENCDESVLSALTEKYIRPMPNTYTFAKSLGENVVNDMCRGKIPVVILRPSIVITTFKEPMVGWIDNFNGPSGLLVAGGKGILRIVYGNENSYTDYIPVDMVIKSIIAASRDFHDKINEEQIDVINICQGNINRISLGEMIEMGRDLRARYPFSKILWYPRFSITSSWLYYYINVLLFHMLPAFFIDLALRLTGNKPMLFSIQRKIYIANVVLKPFMSNTWIFKNDKIFEILERLLPEDVDSFGDIKFDMSYDEKFEYFRLSKEGAAKYILKEEIDESDAPKRNLQRWIEFPTTPEAVNRNIEKFFNRYAIPGVIGSIDCTHIAIISPPNNHPIYPAGPYYNRKGCHSINVQLITNAELKILNVNARSVHDTAIWQISRINAHLQEIYLEGNLHYHLIGDEGYPLSPWLLTQYPGQLPNDSPEGRFNSHLRRARVTIEQVNGILKSRFRCLLKHRTLNYNPMKAGKIVNACAILHNVAFRYNDALPDEELIAEEDLNRPNGNLDQNFYVQGKRKRDSICNQNLA